MLDELKALPQWVCCRATKENCSPEFKPPLDIFGKLASPTDPETWDTYENCKQSKFPSIGFVLTKEDHFTIIDLDEPKTPHQIKNKKEIRRRQREILKAADSYAELSVSEKGIHIIVKGYIPKGVRRDCIEVYSADRYIIFTEKAVNKKSIAHRQELLDLLFKEMNSTTTVELEQIDSIVPDESIIEMAGEAVNSDKFLRLCQGKWEGDYPSQSEADLALLSIFAFYTQDNEQVKRLFRASKLGKRAKAQREGYLNGTLQKIRARQPTKVDTELIKKAMRETSFEPIVVKPCNGITYPPGIVGEVAQFIKDSAVRPVAEVGLAASLAFCAGLWGRSHNVSGTGLNQYIILLAGTGTGKDGAGTGIELLIQAMRRNFPVIDSRIGPAGFASGQALLKTLDKQPSFVSILGEFGITLSQICEPRANIAQTMLKRVLLDLYSRSGFGHVLRPNVYADNEKNTRLISSPAVTILGESTPETFYNGITKEHIAEGLIPRFLVVDYSGPRPKRNRKAFCSPSKKMIERLVETATVAFENEQSSKVTKVEFTDRAQILLDEYDAEADKKINTSENDIDAQLWNRAHLKALKMAGLVAVGVSHIRPIINQEIAQWSIDLVNRDIESVLDRFRTGKHGLGNVRQENDLREAFDAYAKLTQSQRRSYKIPKRLLDKPHIVPLSYLRRRLRVLKAFQNDKRGEIPAIKALLEDLCNNDILLQIPTEEAYAEYKIKSALFVRGTGW